MITKVFATAGLALALFTSAGLFAADEVAGNKSSDKMHARFDSHIDSWAAGTLTAMDLEGKKFTIKGQKLPYATAYAQMMQEIRNKTEGLDANAREAKVAEIRKNWADKLERAKNEDPGNAGDISFAFPAKGTLTILDGRDVRDIVWLHIQKGAAEPQPIPASARDEKREAMKLNFSDLKVGDRVMVGYDSGVITNEAYTVIRESEPSDKAAPATR